jgi:hypothetical protein
MKNVLIPTTLHSDTLKAVKTIIDNVHNKKVKVVLLLLSELPDGITDLLFSSRSAGEISYDKRQVLDECRNYAARFSQVAFHVHHQFGVSGPLMRNIMDHYAINLTVLLPSYRKEKESVHRQAVSILSNCSCPLLFLPEEIESLVLDQAIYVEKEQTRISMEEIQRMLKQEFDIRVVQQAKFNGYSEEELKPVLAETLDKTNIGLLVETRKPEKSGWRSTKRAQISLAEKLGVPVLSIIDN